MHFCLDPNLMIFRYLFLLMAVCLLSACSSGSALDDAVNVMVAAINQQDASQLDQLKMPEEVEERYLQVLTDEILDDTEGELNAKALIGMLGGGDQPFGMLDALRRMMWVKLKQQLVSGFEIDAAELTYEIVKVKEVPNAILVYIPVDYKGFKWFQFLLTEFEGQYYMATPYFELSYEKKALFDFGSMGLS